MPWWNDTVQDHIFQSQSSDKVYIHTEHGLVSWEGSCKGLNGNANKHEWGNESESREGPGAFNAVCSPRLPRFFSGTGETRKVILAVIKGLIRL